MITRTITNGKLKGLPGYREALARLPQSEDVEEVKLGGTAPDCFGRLSMVTRVSYVGASANGNPFVHYVCALDGKDTVENGCGCSNGMAAGVLMRSTALTFLLNSAECDDLEESMRAEAQAKRTAPAVFAHVWPAFGEGFAAFDCYSLTAPIPGHPARSTVSRKTLEEAGYEVPAAELAKAEAALREEVAK